MNIPRAIFDIIVFIFLILDVFNLVILCNVFSLYIEVNVIVDMYNIISVSSTKV